MVKPVILFKKCLLPDLVLHSNCLKKITMKSLKKYILFGMLLAGSAGIFSCKKVLDNVDKTKLTDDTQWANETNADIFVNDLYSNLPDIYGQPEQFDNFTDDNDGGYYYASWKYKQGIVDPASTNYGLFGGAAVGVATI